MKPKIAFYAPIKPPDHAIASGDREIARLLIKALELTGFEVEIASRYIAYQKRPSADLLSERKAGAREEFARLHDDWSARDASQRPALWFTYHPYCKAVDWFGPEMAKTFDIAYVTAEACRTRQATDADWQEQRSRVQSSVRGAAINFCLKRSDFDYLSGFLEARKSITPLVPFIDLAELDALSASVNAGRKTGKSPLLLTAGMMRPGAKTSSFLALARSLEKISDLDWTFAIIGDGPSRPEIEAAFSWAGPRRIEWTGALPRAEVLGLMRQADIFAWPGLGEAIGMVFMEAQSQGLPIVAFRSLGVPLVVDHEKSGLLVQEEDINSYADAVRRLLDHPALRRQMGFDARDHIKARHDIAAAVQTFEKTLTPLLSG